MILKPAPTAFLNKRNIEGFAEKFAAEFAAKNDGTDEKKVKNQMTNLLRDFKNLSASLKLRDKDSNLLKDIKLFLKDSLFGKLSKRDGSRLGFPVFPMAWEGNSAAEAFDGFKETGFDSWAMLNFLAFLGWNPGTEQELFTKEELIEAFSLERIGKSGARFDFEKGKWFNQQYVMKSSNEDLADLLVPMAEEKGYAVTKAFLTDYAGLMKERVTYSTDLLDKGYFLFEEPRAYDERTIQKRWKAENRSKFDTLKALIAETDFDAESLETTIKEFIVDQELSFGEVFPILRIAFSGTTQGPDLFRMMALLGKEEVMARLEKGYSAFDGLIA